jgi:uncharacterized protein
MHSKSESIEMTAPKDSERGYRISCRPRDREIRFQTVIEETDLLVTAEMVLTNEVLDIVRNLRGQLKAHIGLYPEFLTSFVPVDVPAGAAEVVQRMADAARCFSVGPMAAVAGTIAQMVADRLHDLSPNILVENGGDTFMYSTRERIVGLLPFPDQDMTLGLKLSRQDFPCSLCSSSATIGHSISFGRGDLVVVRSQNGSVADAAATALANMLRGKKDLCTVLETAKRLKRRGIQGVFAQCGEDIGVWGEMELIEI